MDNAEVLREYGKYVDAAGAAAPATAGSVAYDLSRFDNRPRVQEALAEAQAGSTPRQRPRVVPRQRVSFSVILIFLAIAGLATLLISSYMDLTVMTAEAITLEKELEALKNDEVILLKQYEGRYILNDIEDYAVNQLGMVKLESNMVEYIELSNPDVITRTDPYQDTKVDGFFHNIFTKAQEILEFLT